MTVSYDFTKQSLTLETSAPAVPANADMAPALKFAKFLATYYSKGGPAAAAVLLDFISPPPAQPPAA